MSGEEDEKELELKDLIVQTLESNGLLSKIKAQLRASVFMALDENDKDANVSKFSFFFISFLFFLNFEFYFAKKKIRKTMIFKI
jgi:hypothetical protein